MLINERDNRHERVLQVAGAMVTAARTAPKAKGVDIIEIVIATDKELITLSDEMCRLAEASGLKFLLRDAENILQADAVVLIGTHSKAQNLNCGYCGFTRCELRPEGVPCAINSADVGIAIGSACSIATDQRIDTRVMFSVGWAAQHLDWLQHCTQVYGILLSCSSKNPFFDRKPREQK